MKRVILFSLLLALSTPAFPAEESRAERRWRRGQTAGYACRDATALSMMGWGLAIAVGIAVLCAMLHNNNSDTPSS